MTLALTYAIFAAIATAINIGVQDLATRLYTGPATLGLSIFAGTLAGLLLKYVLDKRYIFRFRSRDAVHDGRTFLLYTLMGVATTVVFWGFEFAFNYIFETASMRYLGGVIGLGIGYLIKYKLDKKFVFRQEVI